MWTYPLAIRIVERFELYDVWMPHDTHNLQLTILYSETLMSTIHTAEPDTDIPIP